MNDYKRGHCDDNVTELAKRLGRKQPSISDFLNGKGGAAYETAVRFGEIVKKDPAEVIGPREARPGEAMPPVPDGRAAPIPPFVDLPIGRFQMKLARLPGLGAWLDQHPLDVMVSDVLRSVVVFETDPSLAREDGQPHEGWGKFIEDVRLGNVGVIVEAKGTPQRAESIEQGQHPNLRATVAVESRQGRKSKRAR